MFARFGFTNKVCTNNGSGSFTCGDVNPTARQFAAVAVGDLSNDHKLDAVFATFDDPQVSVVCVGDGVGGFACAPVNGDNPPTRSLSVALGDLNGDGTPDAVFGRASGLRNRVCVGNGAGNFSGCADLSSDIGDTYGVALGDANGDNKLDAILARTGATNLVCLGNGNATFAPCTNIESATDDTYAVALGDLNHDGKVDAVFSTMQPGSGPAQFNRVCLGNGAGSFSCSAMGAQSGRFNDVALGDVNNDSHLDAVFAINHGTTPNRVCLGDGAGGFSCANVGTYQLGSGAVALADLNVDGYLDAVFTTEPSPNAAAQVCFGNGTGAFTCTDVEPTSIHARDVAVGKLAW